MFGYGTQDGDFCVCACQGGEDVVELPGFDLDGVSGELFCRALLDPVCRGVIGFDIAGDGAYGPAVAAALPSNKVEFFSPKIS